MNWWRMSHFCIKGYQGKGLNIYVIFYHFKMHYSDIKTSFITLRNALKILDYFHRKALSLIFERVLNMLLKLSTSTSFWCSLCQL